MRLHCAPVFAAPRHRRLGAWIALVAMLAFALMPTLSRALAFSGSGNAAWAEICTPQGMKWLSSAPAAADPGAPPQALPLDPCSFCSLASAGAAPPPGVPQVLHLPLRSAAPPALFLHAPHALHAWASAQPRAPPVPA